MAAGSWPGLYKMSIITIIPLLSELDFRDLLRSHSVQVFSEVSSFNKLNHKHQLHNCQESILCILISSRELYLVTYRFSFADNSIESDNIGMSELCHDGCFLEEFHFIHFCCSFLKKLHSNWNIPYPILP